MNVLVVTHTFPWPENSGGRMRAANIIRALAKIAVVDLLAIEADVVPADQPPGEEVARVAIVLAPRSSITNLGKVRWLLAGSLPYRAATRDYASVASAFRRWARPSYDLVWMTHADGYLALKGLIDAPMVIDLDDLEDEKLRGWSRAAARDPCTSNGDGTDSSLDWLRLQRSRIRSRADARRWGSLQREVAAAARAVTVCSDLDRDRLGVPNAVVIPNGYAPPAHPVGRVEVGRPPILVLPGMFLYPPNADAARFLARRILPLLRARIPDVRVRLVGVHQGSLAEISDPPAFVLTGRVPDMRPELERADAVLVPVRFGSGTRVKILEAFAHRIPVVSTSVGCEGLGVTPGVHLLVADDPEGFAAASALVLRDLPLRRRLVEAAHALYWDRYRWGLIAPHIADLATSIVAGIDRRERSFPTIVLQGPGPPPGRGERGSS